MIRRRFEIDDGQERTQSGILATWDPLKLHEMERHGHQSQQPQQRQHKRIGSRILHLIMVAITPCHP